MEYLSVAKNSSFFQILKAPGEGLIEEMKQLKAENVELKKELLRLQGIEDQLQLLREENEMLKEQNASLKLQAKVRKEKQNFCKLNMLLCFVCLLCNAFEMCPVYPFHVSPPPPSPPPVDFEFYVPSSTFFSLLLLLPFQ